VVNFPTHIPVIKHRRNPTVAVSAIFGSQGSDIGHQPGFFTGNQWLEALGSPGLTQHPACPSLGDSKNLANMFGYLAPP
jgi:hypothetical protein